MKKDSHKLNGKDLLNVGIFTAVYFVFNLLVAAVLSFVPIVSMLIPFASSIILGIPMMLYYMKIKKFGMILITSIIYGVLLALAGVGYYTLIFGSVLALIAEFVIRTGKYKSANRAILAFAIVSVGTNANVLQMVNAGADYIAKKSATYGADYMQLIVSYYNNGWILPIVILSAFIGGLLGGFLGKKIFKKHFLRSGVM